MLEQSRILAAAALIFMIAGSATAQQHEKPVYDVPKSWRAVEPGALVTARFVVANAQTAVVTITRLPQSPASVPPNINRWRSQVDLPAVSDEEALKLLRPIKIDGRDGSLVDLTGPTRPAKRVLVAFTRRGEDICFIRLIGPADVVAEQKPAFDAFVKSIRFERVPDGAAPAAAPLLDGKTLEAWLNELKSDIPSERQKANEALARIQRDLGGAIPILRDLLFNKDFSHNTHASDLFKYLGRSAVPALIQGVWDEEPRTRAASILLLRQDGLDAQAAIPSLLHALKDEHEIIRSLVCGTLAEVDAYAARPRLVEMLEDPESRVRIAAARALISLDSEPDAIIRVLVKEIANPKGGQAESAAEALALLGPEAGPAAKTVADLLAKESEAGQRPLIGILWAIGPSALPVAPALKKVKFDNPETRVAAAVVLWTIAQDDDALTTLRAEMKSTGKSAVLAATALWHIKEDPAPIDALIRLAKKKETAGQAILTLSRFGPPAKAAVPMLIDQLDNADADIAARAAQALGRIGADAKTALPALQKAAGAKDEILRMTAVAARCHIQPEVDSINALGKLAQSDRDAGNRLYALRELQKVWLHAKPVIPIMQELLKDPDESVRDAAAVTLWRIRSRAPESLPPLIALLRSTRWEVRHEAARDIGCEFGRHAEEAVPALAKLLWDPFNLIRMAAAEELARIGPGAKDAVPALTAALESNAAPGCVSAAAEALGRMGADAKPAVPALKRLLGHPNKLVQVHAALALLLIAEDKSGVKQLEANLNARTHGVRITAAEGLWRARKDARVPPALVGALRVVNLLDDEGKNNEPYMLIRALGRIGPEMQAPLSALLAIHRFRYHYDHFLAQTSFNASMRLMPAAFPFKK